MSVKGAQGVALKPTRRPIDPLRGSILDLRQGQWPLEPFILIGEWERADCEI